MNDEQFQSHLNEILANPEAAGLRAALRLKDIEIARANLESARNLYNHAGLLMDKWDRKLKEAEAISRGISEAPTV